MILPSINVPDIEEARRKIEKVEGHAEWLHLDIEDGKFIDHITWNDPSELSGIHTSANYEIHLMIEAPELFAEEWIRAGGKRLIAHFEALRVPQDFLDVCRAHNVEAGIAFNPDTPISMAVPFAGAFDVVLLMAVFPGPSGQGFIPETIRRIRFLREKNPHVAIEVDGGINVGTIRATKEAGANLFVSGSYIFKRPDPIAAMRELEEAVK